MINIVRRKPANSHDFKETLFYIQNHGSQDCATSKNRPYHRLNDPAYYIQLLVSSFCHQLNKYFQR